MCNHPRDKWVGTADGIHCGICGAMINFAEPVKSEPVEQPDAELVEEVKKAVADPEPAPEEPKPESEPKKTEKKTTKKPALKRGAKK